MNIIVASAGKWKSGPEHALYEHFARRITRKMELKEVEERKALPPGALKRAEGERLLAAAGDKSFLVALDPGGKQIDSAGFARQIEAWQSRGLGRLAFLIGGADGLDDALLKRADYALSLGAMIWPHLLVRVLLAEQIYRAQCILSHHPYHRG